MLTRITKFRCLGMRATAEYGAQLRGDVNHAVVVDINQLASCQSSCDNPGHGRLHVAT